MLPSGSGDQFCSPPAVLLWSWLFVVLVYGGLFLCLAPFLWGKVSDLSGGLPLSGCCDGLLFVPQPWRAVWLWMLLTGSGDEFWGSLPALLQVVAYHLPAVSSPTFPAICLLIVCVEISSLPSPLLGVLSPHSCVLVFSSLFIIQFFCCGGQSSQGAMLIYPRTGWGNTVWCLALTCLVCQPSSKQVWSWCLAAAAATCSLSVTWHGEAFHGLGVQGVKVSTLLDAPLLPSMAPVSQQRPWFMELTLSASAPVTIFCN
jgi:hypothetical protein